MFLVMTGSTGHITVLGLIFRHNPIHFSMAGAAVFRNNILTIRYNQWLVGHMTLPATIHIHSIGMREMTILTGLNLSVIGMTGRAGQYCVDTRVILKLLELFSMTGQTGCCYVTSKLYFKGSMGVGMTPHAIIQSKMFLPGCIMAAIAVRNNLHIRRRVTTMTF